MRDEADPTPAVADWETEDVVVDAQKRFGPVEREIHERAWGLVPIENADEQP